MVRNPAATTRLSAPVIVPPEAWPPPPLDGTRRGEKRPPVPAHILPPPASASGRGRKPAPLPKAPGPRCAGYDESDGSGLRMTGGRRRPADDAAPRPAECAGRPTAGAWPAPPRQEGHSRPARPQYHPPPRRTERSPHHISRHADP